ncbi:MAG: M42 family metallopeptidase [Bellilinea sp.]
MSPKDTKLHYSPLIGADQIALLERLSNAVAVSGSEGEVRKIVLAEIKDVADDIKVDALGNVLAVRHTRQEPALRVMLAAHMDEIGFMLVEGEEGLFRFEIVGGIDVRQLPGKTVLVGKDHLPGVIGTKPIHHTTADERRNAIPLDTLRIDVGIENGKKVKPGDRATFATRFQQIGPSLIGKALDDRLGVATLIELLRHAPAHIELQAAFTVQEEVGLRGARVAAFALDPQVAIAIDSTPAGDLPRWDGEVSSQYNTRLDGGPAIYVADKGTLSDPRMLRHLYQTAEAHNIPYQIRQPGGGGTDAGAIHKQRAGIPVVSVSIPGRYAHTAALVTRLDDWQYTLSLLYYALERISPAILDVER